LLLRALDVFHVYIVRVCRDFGIYQARVGQGCSGTRNHRFGLQPQVDELGELAPQESCDVFPQLLNAEAARMIEINHSVGTHDSESIGGLIHDTQEQRSSSLVH
jgi:hypothetical protein